MSGDQTKQQRLIELVEQLATEQNYEAFVRDGLRDEKAYETSPIKICHILKEDPYGDWCDFDGRGTKEENLSDEMKENSTHFWTKLTILTQIILHSAAGTELTPEKAIALGSQHSVLNQTAFLEIIKEQRGETQTSWEDLYAYAQVGKECIKQQLQVLNPDVIVCWGWQNEGQDSTKKALTEYIFDNKSIEKDLGNDIFIWNKRLLVSCYHPSYTGWSKKSYADFYCTCFQKNEIQDFLKHEGKTMKYSKNTDNSDKRLKLSVKIVIILAIVIVLGIGLYFVINTQKTEHNSIAKITKIQLMDKLEVLYTEVCIFDVVDDDEFKTASTFFGFGIFTTDLERADFDVDAATDTVCITLDPIILSSFGINENKTKLLYADSQDGLWQTIKSKFSTEDNKFEGGFKMANEQRKAIYKQIRIELENNQDLFQRAQIQAKTSIEKLVKSANVSNKNLQVIVDFRK